MNCPICKHSLNEYCACTDNDRHFYRYQGIHDWQAYQVIKKDNIWLRYGITNCILNVSDEKDIPIMNVDNIIFEKLIDLVSRLDQSAFLDRLKLYQTFS